MNIQPQLFRVYLIASGRVQGVGFREFVRRIASSMSLTGFVKNLDDGNVEIMAEGTEEELARLKRRISVKMPLGIHVEGLRGMKEERITERSRTDFAIAR
jgi:acylphosphatase